MATPKLYDRYPYDYAHIFEVAIKENYTLIFNSKLRAKRLRSKLYAFRTALLDEPHKNPRLALAISLIKMSVQENVLVLTYGPNQTEEDSTDAKTPIPESSRLLDAGDL